jgi:hypothetical protein
MPGNYIGDAWFFVDPGQQVHCFFLTAPDSLPLEERWWNWDIGHAAPTWSTGSISACR